MTVSLYIDVHKIFAKKTFVGARVHQSKYELEIANKYLLVDFNLQIIKQ